MNYPAILLTVALGSAPAMALADDNTVPPCGPGMMYGQGYGSEQAPCRPGYGPGPGYGYGPGMMRGYGRGHGMMRGPGYGYGRGMGPGMMYGPGYGGQYGPPQGYRGQRPYMPMHPYGYGPDNDDE